MCLKDSNVGGGREPFYIILLYEGEQYEKGKGEERNEKS